MAQKTRIKILTSDSTGVPLNSGNRILKTGEMAYSSFNGTGGDRLYIGTGAESAGIAAAQEVIGGVYFTNMLDHTAGTLTADSALIVNNNKHINELNIGNLRIDSSGGTGQVVTAINTNTSLSGASDSQLASALAIKTYVDGLDRDDDLTFSGNSGSGTIDLDTGTLTIAGGTGLTSVGTSGNGTITVNLDDTSTDMTATNSGQYGSATAIPTFTVDRQGRLTAAGTVAISSNFTITGGTGTDVFNNGETLNFEGTANEIVTTVSNNKVNIALPDDVTIGNDLTVTTDLQVNGAAVIEGNLTVNGTTTSVNSSEITINDPVQVLGDNTSADDGKDRGIKFKYYDDASSSVKQGFFGFDGGANNSGTERFVFKKVISTDDDDLDSPWGDAEFNEVYTSKIQSVSGNLTLEAAGSNSIVLNDTVDLNGALDVSGALSASSLTLTTALAVAQGGTGNTSFTNNGVLYGDAGNALDVTAASTQVGAVLQTAAAGGVPAFSNVIDGGTY